MPVGVFRRRLYRAAAAAALLLFALGLIFCGRETAAAAAAGIKLCARVLIPSLFPFFVVSALAVDTGLARFCGRALRGPMRLLFNVPGACAPAFALGLVGGYPVGAKTAIDLYRGGLCSRAQAQRLLAFCNNSGPAFILGAVGGLFGSPMAGLLLYGSHILASVSVGILLRRWGGDPPPADGGPDPRPQPPLPPAGRAFSRAVTGSFQQILNICAFVIFFSVAIRLLCVTGILPGAARALAALAGLDRVFVEKLLSGLIEVTSGVYGLSGTAVSLPARLAAAAFMLGWAGLSVHCQVLNFIGESGLSCRPYVVGKILHSWLAALYTWLGARLLPFDARTGPALQRQLLALTSRGAGRCFREALLSALSVWLVLAGLGLVFTCQTRRNWYNNRKRGRIR